MFWKKKKSKNREENSQKMTRLHRYAKHCGQGILQRLAMRKIEKMDSKEREKLMQKALSPENIAKNKDKIFATMEQMKESGQLTDEQIQMAKEKLGI